jgi:hypothetical protein
MRQSIEIAIELNAQELLAPPCDEGFVEIDDIATIITPQSATVVANADEDDSFEIELTGAEMDELLADSP